MRKLTTLLLIVLLALSSVQVFAVENFTDTAETKEVSEERMEAKESSDKLFEIQAKNDSSKQSKTQKLPYRLRLKFDPNGGTGRMLVKTIYSDTEFELPQNAFKKAGCEFLGWATSPEGKVQYSDCETISTNTNLTLYAKWKRTSLEFISSLEEYDLILENYDDSEVEELKSELAAKTEKLHKNQALLKKYKKLKTEEKRKIKALTKQKNKIKKLKIKKYSKKNRRKLKSINKKLKKAKENLKKYSEKIEKYKERVEKFKKQKSRIQRKLDAFPQHESKKAFKRLAGAIDGKYIENLINYKVIKKGTVENVSLESATPYLGADGHAGELRGRKTVVNYVKNAAQNLDEVYAINGSGWSGPWASESCTYDKENKKWIVPETEKIGGWHYSIPNPFYEQQKKKNKDAKKTIGQLPYSEKYSSFRIQLCGMQKSGSQIIQGPINSAHTEWIAFKSDGSFVYGSNEDREVPSDEYVAAVSGARILENGVCKESGWASGGPKTILGTKPNGDIVIMSTVGRMKELYSFTPYEHAAIMEYLGCNNALCLDGGGSTSTVYKFRNSDSIINIATCEYDITSRPVANAVLFYMK